jgi:hypothetical protein
MRRSHLMAFTPDAACLELSIVTDSKDPRMTGGCVNPVLAGYNGCSETFSIAAEVAAEHQPLSAPAGTDFAFEIDLGCSTNSGDAINFAIPASLGQHAVAIAFHTWD